ncbi:GntR family transcriptional regulator [Pseudalkalibacillus berkeleyi]|uniref:GntR family transcriptional regulator n=1 Tax=Pseudalkalibacillus berkeleyi TaxID=1069813 RepID=A0ABS9GZ32_9BACL|nr:GntR family transcriptional regulator [Pseudalkalibacillus berkeleyi]MCF6136748.1 GntR family transcriptional regulator [Pseudalkalibacillus berkeleyi]
MNKQQYAYKLLRARILDGSYGPGFRIVIDQIAREIETSAIPIREALRQLESDGLIQFKPYSGAVVTPINENEYLETLSVLAVIEGYATAISGQHFPKERIPDLEEINGKMKQALEDLDFTTFGSQNRAFHALTYEYCDNQYLVENIRSTWKRLDSIRRSGSAFMPVRAKESVREHEEIIRLLSTRAEAHVIEEYVRDHKLNTVKSFYHQRH